MLLVVPQRGDVLEPGVADVAENGKGPLQVLVHVHHLAALHHGQVQHVVHIGVHVVVGLAQVDEVPRGGSGDSGLRP